MRYCEKRGKYLASFWLSSKERRAFNRAVELRMEGSMSSFIRTAIINEYPSLMRDAKRTEGGEPCGPKE